MGSIITSKKGLLKLVSGQINIEIDGSKQPAKDGEQLPKGAVLHISENATYEITFDDGTKLSNETPDTTNETAITNTPPNDNDATLDEIQALQDQIVAGEDPTKALPETAAGNTPISEGGNSFVSIARVGAEMQAQAGYDTATITNTSALALRNTDSTDTPLNSFNLAQLTDNFVNGVTYTTSSGLTGRTGDQGAPGSFAYNDGDIITFSIGNVIIAQFSADLIKGPILFLQDIATTGLSDVNLNYVENMAILLQALDNDLSDGVDDGVLNTNSLINTDSSFANNINILQAIHDALANYIDPTTNAPVNMANADKEILSLLLKSLGIIFNRETETSEDGKNVFESEAMEHVADTITDLAGDRAPEEFDARLADTIDVPGGTIEYYFNQLNGQLFFSTQDLLEGAVGQQVLFHNLVVKNVRLSAEFEDIGTLVDLGGGNYVINLKDGITPYDLENLKIDYRVEDWTAFKEVTSSTLDLYKSHLSTVIQDVNEGDGFNTFELVSQLTFDTDSQLTINFTSELLSQQFGYPIAEYADDYLVPIQYSNDGGITWQEMTIVAIDYSGSIPRPIFGFTITAGSNSVLIRVPIFDDSIIEPTEYFRAVVGGDNYYDEEVKFGIIDNDSESTLPAIDIDFAIVVEGTPNAVFTLTLSKASTETITVKYSAAELSALFGQDFLNVSGTVTFLPGQTTAYITVPIVDDLIEEISPEFALINLFDPVNATLADAQGTLRIFDNDGPDNTAISIDLDPITGDNIIDNKDTSETVVITGTVTFDPAIKIGIVILTINGKQYQTLMKADGTFSVEVKASDLYADTDTVVDAKVYGFGNNGAKGTATTTEDYQIVLTNDTNTVNEDTDAIGNVLINDSASNIDSNLSVVSFTVNGNTVIAGTTITLEGGSLVINADGSYRFTPGANWNGVVPVVTYVTNTGDSSTLTITVTPVNDDFTDNNEVVSMAEDSGSQTGNVIDGASPDGTLSVQSFSIAGVTGPFVLGQAVAIAGVGSFTLNANGSYSFTPAANYNGPVPVITYVLTDGSGATDSSTLSITVTPVNDDFTDNNEVVSMAEDSGSQTGNVIDGASPDGTLSVQSFSIAGVTGPFVLGQAVAIAGVGSFTLNANGSYSFTPAANYNGPVPVITYVLTDGSGATDSSTLTITVTPVNDDFTDNNEVVSMAEDSGSQTGNVIDGVSPDGALSVQSFSIAGVTGPFVLGQAVAITGVGSFTLNANGSYSFTPAANYNGPVPVITYVLTDGSGATDSSTLTITVTPVNDDFTDNNEVVSVAEDSGSQTGNVIDGVSPDGALSVQSFSIAGVTGPFVLGQAVAITGVGSFTLNANGSYSFTPAANYNGPVPVITYVLTDGSGATDSSTLTITVTPVNDDFTDNNEVVSMAEDSGSQTGNVIDGVSPDGALSVQSFSIAGVTGPFVLGQAVAITGVGSFTLNANGSYSFTPAANYNGPVPVITYVLTDGSGATDSSTLTITVTPVNDDFTDNNEVVSMAEDSGSQTGNVIDGVSPDGALSVQSFSIAGVTGPFVLGQAVAIAGVGSFTLNANGSYSFTPAANYNGPVPVITYVLTDGSGATDSSTLTITVTPVNDDFTDNNEVVSMAEDSGSQTGNVIDGVSPDGALSVQSFSIAGVTGPFVLGQAVAITGVGSFTLNANGSYSFTPAANYNGPVPVITYVLTDGSGATDSSTLTITVTPVNDDFTDNNEVVSMAEDSGSQTGNVIDGVSPDGALSVQSFSIAGVTGPFVLGQAVAITGVGSFTLNANGSYSFTPAANYNGPVPVITYVLTDGSGATDSSTLTITVTPVNDDFTDNNEVVSMAEDSGSQTGNVIDGVSPDGALSVQSFSIAGVTGPFVLGQAVAIAGVGSFTLNANGSYSFTPAANYNGPVPVITYVLTDGSGATDSSTLTITVTPVNDDFTDNNEVVSMAEDSGSQTGNVIDGVSPDGALSVQSFSIAGVTGPFVLGQAVAITGVGSFTLNANGSYSFTPAANYNGPVPVITYVLTDGSGATDSSTLTITVTPVNDDFTDNNEVVSMAEDSGSQTGNVIDGVSPDGALSVQSFSIAGVTGPFVLGQAVAIAGVGSFTLNANGSYSFTPAANYNGPVPVITYVLTDGSGATDSSTLTITVTPVNDDFTDNNEVVSMAEDSGSQTGNVIDGVSPDGALSVQSFSIAGVTGPFVLGQAVAITGVGSFTLNANGSYSFTPAANYNGPVPVITYVLTDGSGATDSSTLTITVTPVNDDFTDNNEVVSMAEDSGSQTGNVIDGVSPDGALSVQSFSIAGVTGPFVLGQAVAITGVGSFTLNANGSYSFTPAANYNGPVPVITYVLTDGSGATDSSTLTITVTPVNDDFTDNNEVVSMAEDSGSQTGNVIDGVSPDGALSVQSFSIAGVTGPFVLGQAVAIAGVGSFTLNANGSYSFTPAANYNGPVPVITYVLTDGSGATDSSTLTITVTPVNDDFTDNNEVVSMAEDSGSQTGNVIDGVSPDGALSVQSFSIAGVTGPFVLGQAVAIAGVGSFTLNANGSYSFTPAANYNGPVPVITYVLTDGSGATDSSTLTITVTPVNDDFTDNNEVVSMAEDSGSQTGNVIDGVSPDGALSVQSFSIAGVTGPFVLGQAVAIAGVGSFTLNANGSYSFTPAANYNGPVPVITYVLTDGSGATDSSTLTITVTPVNDDFTDNNEVVSMAEDSGSQTGNVIDGVSPDGALSVQSFSIAGVTGPFVLGQAVAIAGVGSFTLNANGSYSFTPAANYNGPVPVITYVLTDGSGATDSSTLSITVTPSDDNVTIINTAGSLNVYESALANGTGNPSSGQVSAQGNMTITANDGLNRIEITNAAGVTSSISLATLMAATLLTPIAIAGADGILYITGYSNGQLQYTYTLSNAQAHTSQGNDTLNDNFQVKAFDTDGDSATTTITTTIHDDVATAHNDADQLEVVLDSFNFSGIVANWTTINGGSDVRKYDGPDNDSGKDQVRWGDPSNNNGSQSGYGFADNDAALNGSLSLNQDIVLGTFTHYNFPIDSGTSISAATMQITFNVTDAYGVTTPVTLTLNFSHNETPNSGADPRDIVTVGQSSVTFNYEGQVYTMQVIGFKDNNGNLVTSIYTNENDATSYQLVVRMVKGDGYTLPHTDGNVLTNDTTGADTAATIIGIANGDHTTTGVLGHVGATINGTYGTLVIYADGTYKYQLTASADQIPTSGAIETFTYTMQDGDGDKSSAKLEINVTPVNANGLNAVDANALTTQGSNLNDTISVVNGENGSNQKQLNVNFGGNSTGIITNKDGNDVITTGANLNSHSKTDSQVISSGDGNDHIETGKGDDVIYAGKTGTANYASDAELELSINNLSTHHIMTGNLTGSNKIVDQDGLLLSQDVASQQADVVNGGSGNDRIYGQSGSDILYGHTGNDHIDGGDHNDGLRGGTGDDTLIGGLGDDVLRGDSGVDTFVWRYADADKGTDHIVDFNVREDKLDLSDLLQGETADTLENYLFFSLDKGSTIIDIDANKDGVFDQHIVLDGVDLYSQYGVADNAGIINGLLGSNGNGPLIIDTQPVTPEPSPGMPPLEHELNKIP